jgi:hypothetical protein
VAWGVARTLIQATRRLQAVPGAALLEAAVAARPLTVAMVLLVVLALSTNTGERHSLARTRWKVAVGWSALSVAETWGRG